MSSAPFEGDTELQELVIDQSYHSTPPDPDNLAVAGIEPAAFSTPKPQEQVKHHDQGEISDERLLEVQSLKEGEAQPETEAEDLRAALSVSRSDLSSRKAQSDSVTGLPSAAQVADQFQTNLPATKLASQANFDFIDEESLASTSLLIRQNDDMGAAESRGTPASSARNIMTAEPQDLVQNRKRVMLSEVTGNCRPWSDHVYYKLFMDTEGRNATLMVLKCEISYVDVFTDEEHSLYKSRFIGGKSDGVAQLFVFDLMKASWEEKIPKSQAIELNVDIVMSSSPIHFCCDSLLSLIQLEKTFLKHRNFDGQLNVMIRFAHGFGWDIKDDAIREKVHTGLCNLFREGVNLEVMSADVIMEEMRVDGILTTDDERLKHYIARRHSWAGPPIKTKSTKSPDNTGANRDGSDYGETSGREALSTFGRKAAAVGRGDSLASMTDEYFHYLHTSLWNIIQDTKRIQDILSETIDDN